MSRKGKTDTVFVGKLIHASIVNRYDSDTSGNLLVTTQSKSCYLNICKVQD
jgi:23S rRNA-/tRNA-specific pseudouridylate synthase